MVGIDEVGRGCLAGPLLVVAARSKGPLPPGLKDSKLLGRPRREEVYPLLIQSFEFGEGWVKAAEIDRLGLARCLRLGVRRAVNRLLVDAGEEVIIDGSVNYVPRLYKNSRCLVDADDLLPLVSAASIYAKVTRDRFMMRLAKKYPKYSFDNHVGYGTPQHQLTLSSYGPIRYVHRVSFAPLGGYRNQ